MRKKHYTPPPTLFSDSKVLETSQRACIIFAKALEQELSVPIPPALLTKLTGASSRSQSRIAASKEIRTLHNGPDNGPDPRGRPAAFIRSDTRAKRTLELSMRSATKRRSYHHNKLITGSILGHIRLIGRTFTSAMSFTLV